MPQRRHVVFFLVATLLLALDVTAGQAPAEAVLGARVAVHSISASAFTASCASSSGTTR